MATRPGSPPPPPPVAATFSFYGHPWKRGLLQLRPSMKGFNVSRLVHKGPSVHANIKTLTMQFIYSVT